MVKRWKYNLIVSVQTCDLSKLLWVRTTPYTSHLEWEFKCERDWEMIQALMDGGGLLVSPPFSTSQGGGDGSTETNGE